MGLDRWRKREEKQTRGAGLCTPTALASPERSHGASVQRAENETLSHLLNMQPALLVCVPETHNWHVSTFHEHMKPAFSVNAMQCPHGLYSKTTSTVVHISELKYVTYNEQSNRIG